MNTPEIIRDGGTEDKIRNHEIPVPLPGLEEITPDNSRAPNPEMGNIGGTIAEIERKERDERRREKEADVIIEKRDKKIH